MSRKFVEKTSICWARYANTNTFMNNIVTLI